MHTLCLVIPFGKQMFHKDILIKYKQITDEKVMFIFKCLDSKLEPYETQPLSAIDVAIICVANIKMGFSAAPGDIKRVVELKCLMLTYMYKLCESTTQNSEKVIGKETCLHVKCEI